jgi:predicted ATP-grasp superfamily ATP-dependent carboligase
MIRLDDSSTPVVVLGQGAYGQLGIFRSLGRLGIPVYLVSLEPRPHASYSRYCRGHFVGGVSARSPEALAARLLEAGRRIGRKAVLIPTSDDGAIFVDAHAEALEEHFLFPRQPCGLPRSLVSKKEMYYLARALGIPTAETQFPACRQDVAAFAQAATFPLLLKGIDTKRLSTHARAGGRGMFLVSNAAELLRKYDALEGPAAPNLMLQEYIPGDDDSVWMFNGYFDRQSDCVLGFTGQKLRQWPAHRGVTTLGICRSNATVEEMTRRFMKAIGYRGVLDIGYRWDARDGLYKVLDVNPRIGATFRLFVADNGMDVARALYLDLTGQPIDPGRQCDGRKWLVEDIDLISSYCFHREGGLTFKDWVSSYCGVDEGAYFALDDLLPLLARIPDAVRKLWCLATRRREPEQAAGKQPVQASGVNGLSDPAGRAGSAVPSSLPGV